MDEEELQREILNKLDAYSESLMENSDAPPQGKRKPRGKSEYLEGFTIPGREGRCESEEEEEGKKKGRYDGKIKQATLSWYEEKETNKK